MLFSLHSARTVTRRELSGAGEEPLRRRRNLSARRAGSGAFSLAADDAHGADERTCSQSFAVRHRHPLSNAHGVSRRAGDRTHLGRDTNRPVSADGAFSTDKAVSGQPGENDGSAAGRRGNLNFWRYMNE